jgi:tryptophan 2,3-dioxygenase
MADTMNEQHTPSLPLAEPLQHLLHQLQEKYENAGQDLAGYLEGLYHSDFLNYWDYIQLDTLLTLQRPRTTLPDENIFIMFHQVAELYFKLVLQEIEQICFKPDLTPRFFLDRMSRINRYFQVVIDSFDVMVDGMEVGQFMQFRMALLPASGFQSGQFRMIEICASDFNRLLDQTAAIVPEASLAEQMAHIYWKKGGVVLATGEKTLTLRQFEAKYEQTFLQLAERYQHHNLRQTYLHLQPKGPEDEALIPDIHQAMKQFDVHLNINWRLAHYKSAVRYLFKDPETIFATGGTNWQKYLPPRFQRQVFYPELWTDLEKENWGRAWVDSTLKALQKEREMPEASPAH